MRFRVGVAFVLGALAANLADAQGVAQPAWPAAGYAEVRFYFYNAKGETSIPVYAARKFSDTIVNAGGAKLQVKQVERLTAATTGSHPGHMSASCYRPRHAFVFLDKEGIPLDFVEICFECAGYRRSDNATKNFDLPGLADLVEEMGLPLGGKLGNAAAFRREFQNMLDKP